MVLTKIFDDLDALKSACSLEGFLEVVLELLIWKFSCLKTTPDQVVTRLWLRVEVVYRCPKPTANPISDHRIPDLSADRVGHSHWRLLGVPNYERYSKGSTLSPASGGSELRELPSGANPTGHLRLRPSTGDGPYHDGPLERRDRRECAYVHENRVF